MPNDDCIFCKIIAGDIPCFKLYEDAATFAFMDINPANPGHALAIPRAHYPDLIQSPDEALAAVIATARRVAAAVQKTVKPDGINLVQANGPGAAQSVFHLHVHVVPRFKDDGLMLNWGINPGDMDEIKQLSEQIAANIEA